MRSPLKISVIFLLMVSSVQGRARFAPISIAEDVDQPWRVTSLIEHSGLDRRVIFYVDFQHDGTAWIASSDGLTRYDGYRWSHYSIDDGLPSNFVRCVRVLRDGRVWVGTDKGLAVWDGKGRFRVIAGEQTLQSIRRIAEDPDGTIWLAEDRWPVATSPGGLVSYRDGRWKLYGVDSGLPSDRVIDYFRSSDGRQIASTSSGVAVRNGERWMPLTGRGNSDDWKAHQWVAVESEREGLLVGSSARCLRFQKGQWRIDPELRSRYLVRTSDDQVLSCARYGTETDQARINVLRNGRFEPLSAGFRVSAGNSDIEHIAEAPDGSIWVCGSRGANHIQPKTAVWQIPLRL